MQVNEVLLLARRNASGGGQGDRSAMQEDEPRGSARQAGTHRQSARFSGLVRHRRNVVRSDCGFVFVDAYEGTITRDSSNGAFTI